MEIIYQPRPDDWTCTCPEREDIPVGWGSGGFQCDACHGIYYAPINPSDSNLFDSFAIMRSEDD